MSRAVVDARAPDAVRSFSQPGWLAVVAAAALLLFLVLPTAALVLRSLSPTVAASILTPPALTALRLSLVTTLAAMTLTVLFGTPLAYLLGRHRFRGRGLVDALVDLPLMLPPVIAGVGLLLVFGRRGFIGAPLAEAGLSSASRPRPWCWLSCWWRAPSSSEL